MADIFHEVDEDVRRDQLKKLWERYGHYGVALVLLILAGVGGWRGYEYWQAKKIATAGAMFEQALSLAEEGKHQDAAEAFARIIGEGTGGYRMLARLREASEIAQRDVKAGVSAFDAIASDAAINQDFRDLAGVRAGFVLVDNAPLDEMRRRLEPLAGPSGTFRHSARELLALAAYRAGDMAEARRWSELALGDPAAPASMRARLETLMALVPAAKS